MQFLGKWVLFIILAKLLTHFSSPWHYCRIRLLFTYEVWLWKRRCCWKLLNMDDIKSKLHYLLSNKKHFGQLLMMTNKNIMLFQKKLWPSRILFLCIYAVVDTSDQVFFVLRWKRRLVIHTINMSSSVEHFNRLYYHILISVLD